MSTKEPGKDKYQVRIVVERLYPGFDPVNGWDHDVVTEIRHKTVKCRSKEDAVAVYEILNYKLRSTEIQSSLKPGL